MSCRGRRGRAVFEIESKLSDQLSLSLFRERPSSPYLDADSAARVVFGALDVLFALWSMSVCRNEKSSKFWMSFFNRLSL